MSRRVVFGAFAAVLSMAVSAAPVFAHGDHDARPLARHLAAGPFHLSLWQVYADAGSAMTPHLIVMVDDGPAVASAADLIVTVNAVPTQVYPSTTTRNGWETRGGLAEGDVVTISVSDGTQAWAIDPLVVPAPPTSMLPMEELIYTSIALTIVTAWWAVGRTARAWRKPAISAS
jgi:hypothetical protein